MKRWHAVTGLAFGAVTVTWAFSGFLSMGPFPVVNRLANVVVFGGAAESTIGDAGIAAALRGSDEVPIAMYEARHPSAAIEALKRSTFVNSTTGPSEASLSMSRLTVAATRASCRFTGHPSRPSTLTQSSLSSDQRAGDAIRDVHVMHEYDAYTSTARPRVPCRSSWSG